MIYTLISKDKTGSVQNVISFSTVSEYSKTMSATVTTNPVENGTYISDGVIVELPTFDLSAIITSYDIFDDSREITWDGEKFSSSTNNAEYKEPVEKVLESLLLESEVFTLLVSKENDRSSNLTTKHENLLKSKYQEFNNCVITNYTISDTAGTNDVFFVKLTIKQLNIAFVRKDQLSVSEQRPTLQEIQQKQTTVGSSSSTTDTSSTDTSNLGTTNGDASKIEESKKSLSDNSESTFEINKEKSIQDRLALEKQAYERAITLVDQGDKSVQVRETPNGYAVYK